MSIEIKRIETKKEWEEVVDLADSLYDEGQLIRRLKDIGINKLKLAEEAYVVKENGVVVGYVICATPSTSEKIDKNAFNKWKNVKTKGKWIRGLQIGIAPKYRKSGIATKLFNYLSKNLEKEGYDYLYTTIKKSNIPSIKFSEGVGFRKIADIDESLQVFEKKIGGKYEQLHKKC